MPETQVNRPKNDVGGKHTINKCWNSMTGTENRMNNFLFISRFIIQQITTKKITDMRGRGAICDIDSL